MVSYLRCGDVGTEGFNERKADFVAILALLWLPFGITYLVSNGAVSVAIGSRTFVEHGHLLRHPLQQLCIVFDDEGAEKFVGFFHVIQGEQ